MSQDTSNPSPPTPGPAPSRLRAYMAAPLALSALALVGAVWAVFKFDQGRPAAGERVVMTMETACASNAAPVLKRRVEAVGLGDPILEEAPPGLRLTATLPGLPDDRAAIPALLLAPGKMEVHAAGRTVGTHEDVTGTALNMDASGSPYAEIALNGLALAELREATKVDPTFELVFDGQTILRTEVGAIRDELIRVTPEGGSPGAAMRKVADWTILLSAGALPCEVTLAEITAATAPPPG